MTLAEDHVREFARACVRAGLLSADEAHAEVVTAIRQNPQRAGEVDALNRRLDRRGREQGSASTRAGRRRPTTSGCSRRSRRLALDDVEVLQGCEDHWAAKRLIEERTAAGTAPRGVVVHPAGRLARSRRGDARSEPLARHDRERGAPGDALLDVLGVLEKHGLTARFDEGRIEVDAHWHRRIAR